MGLDDPVCLSFLISFFSTKSSQKNMRQIFYSVQKNFFTSSEEFLIRSHLFAKRVYDPG